MFGLFTNTNDQDAGSPERSVQSPDTDANPSTEGTVNEDDAFEQETIDPMDEVFGRLDGSCDPIANVLSISACDRFAYGTYNGYKVTIWAGHDIDHEFDGYDYKIKGSCKRPDELSPSAYESSYGFERMGNVYDLFDTLVDRYDLTETDRSKFASEHYRPEPDDEHDWQPVRKKPVEVEARGPYYDPTVVETLEGDFEVDENYAEDGFYIIRGVEGEVYPCQKAIFEDTYDAIDPDESEGLDQ